MPLTTPRPPTLAQIARRFSNSTTFHRLQGYLVTYFTHFSFLFTLAKFDICHCDVTSSCITNFHTNLAYLGLAKIIAAQDGIRSLFFKDAG